MKPLTREELLQMDGKPVYLYLTKIEKGLGWGIVSVEEQENSLEPKIKFVTQLAVFEFHDDKDVQVFCCEPD